MVHTSESGTKQTHMGSNYSLIARLVMVDVHSAYRVRHSLCCLTPLDVIDRWKLKEYVVTSSLTEGVCVEIGATCVGNIRHTQLCIDSAAIIAHEIPVTHWTSFSHTTNPHNAIFLVAPACCRHQHTKKSQ